MVGILNEMCKWLNENIVIVYNDRFMYIKVYEIMIVIILYLKIIFNFLKVILVGIYKNIIYV